MELSLAMKLRIAAAAAVGAVLLGIFGWPLVAPADPFGTVSVAAGSISFTGVMILPALAFSAGFIACFVSWPFGKQIGVLAAPAGLAIWSLRSGSMADLIRQNSNLTQRQEIFAALRWEPLFWLAIVAAGFAGVLLAQKVFLRKAEPNETQGKPDSKANTYLNAAGALIGSGLIAQFCIGLLAQDIRTFDGKLGSIVTQPATGQIVFAVFVSFGLAGFVVKKFLNAGYIWPIIASALLTGFAITAYLTQDVLQRLVQYYPPVFFSNAVISILPVQMVSFGTLGAIAGYWLAVRYNYWRKYESKPH